MTASKDTNPKDAIGVTKAGLARLPMRVLVECDVGMLEGALKYGAFNWREAGVRFSVYFDAQVGRHLTAFMEGEDIDAVSGLSHVTKAIIGLIIVRDSMIEGNWVDDRPPKARDGWLEPLNAKVKELLAKYPNPVAPFTERRRKQRAEAAQEVASAPPRRKRKARAVRAARRTPARRRGSREA